MDNFLIKQNKDTSWRKIDLNITKSKCNDTIYSYTKIKRESDTYSFLPSGVLCLNDSTFFAIGRYGTYNYEGIILKTVDYGKTWSVFFNKTKNSWIDAYNMYFFTDSIGIVLFDSYNNRKTYAITFNQGKTWEIKKIKKK